MFKRSHLKVLLAVACIVGAMAVEENESVPSVVSVEEQPAAAETSDNKDLTTAEGHLGAYGGYGAGLGFKNGLYGAGYGGLGYGQVAGYGGDLTWN